MYVFVESHIVEDVRSEFSGDAKKKFQQVRTALRKDPHAASHDCRQQKDGSWEISFSVGLRKVLIGYDVDDKQRLLFLNYVKWDRFWEVLDWAFGLLDADPGEKK